MAFKEYPKMIYIEGKGTIVITKEEEANLVKKEETPKETKS